MYVIGLTGRYMEIVIICAFPKMFYFSKNNADIDGQESFPPRQKDINTILRTHTNAYFWDKKINSENLTPKLKPLLKCFMHMHT